MFFDHLENVGVDPIISSNFAFLEDPRTDKINLAIGVYKTLDLKSLVLKRI